MRLSVLGYKYLGLNNRQSTFWRVSPSSMVSFGSIVGKIESKRRRGRERMRWLESITNSKDINLNKLWETVEDREWRTGKPGMLQFMGSQSPTRLSDWTSGKRPSEGKLDSRYINSHLNHYEEKENKSEKAWTCISLLRYIIMLMDVIHEKSLKYILLSHLRIFFPQILVFWLIFSNIYDYSGKWFCFSCSRYFIYWKTSQIQRLFIIE